MGTTYIPTDQPLLDRQPPMKDAACRDHPGLPWVPDAYNGQMPPAKLLRDIATMREICHTCVHLIECRDYALSDASIYGIWGGLTSNDRREVRSGRRRIAHNGKGVVLNA